MIYKCLDKKSKVVLHMLKQKQKVKLLIHLPQINNYLMNYINQSSKNFKHVKYIHLLWITYRVLVLLICNQLINKYNKGIHFLLCYQRLKLKFCLCRSNDRYDADPGGQAAFYGGQKTTV